MKVTQKPIKTEKMNGSGKQEPINKPITLLKTLYNNDACMTAGKNFPFWVAILFLVFGVGVSFIPSTVNAATTKGDTALTSTNYGLDVGMEEFSKVLNGKVYDEATQTTSYDHTKDIDFVVHEVNGTNTSGEAINYYKLELADHTNWDAICKTETLTLTDGTEKTYSYYSFTQELGSVNVEDGTVNTIEKLRVFFIEDELYDEGKAFNFFANDEVFGYNSSLTSDVTNYHKPCSTLVLGSTSFYLSNYTGAATEYDDYSDANGLYAGDYLKVTQETYLKDLIHATDDADNIGAYTTLANSKWCTFFDDGYKTTRTRTTWVMFGIVSGMNLVITVLFGFLLWVMTRGKKNPNRDLKIGQTFKMAFFASVTPGLLTLILGFIWSSFASLAYVALMSIRVMWMSMKTLRPAQ